MKKIRKKYESFEKFYSCFYLIMVFVFTMLTTINIVESEYMMAAATAAFSTNCAVLILINGEKAARTVNNVASGIAAVISLINVFTNEFLSLLIFSEIILILLFAAGSYCTTEFMLSRMKAKKRELHDWRERNDR